jgi:hypothetical protein
MPKGNQGAAIQLSKRRRAGENIPPPPKGRYSEVTRRRAKRDLAAGRSKRGRRKSSGRRRSSRK